METTRVAMAAAAHARLKLDGSVQACLPAKKFAVTVLTSVLTHATTATLRVGTAVTVTATLSLATLA